jgi:hypothetical protein
MDLNAQIECARSKYADEPSSVAHKMNSFPDRFANSFITPQFNAEHEPLQRPHASVSSISAISTSLHSSMDSLVLSDDGNEIFVPASAHVAAALLKVDAASGSGLEMLVSQQERPSPFVIWRSQRAPLALLPDAFGASALLRLPSTHSVNATLHLAFSSQFLSASHCMLFHASSLAAPLRPLLTQPFALHPSGGHSTIQLPGAVEQLLAVFLFGDAEVSQQQQSVSSPSKIKLPQQQFFEVSLLYVTHMPAIRRQHTVTHAISPVSPQSLASRIQGASSSSAASSQPTSLSAAALVHPPQTMVATARPNAALQKLKSRVIQLELEGPSKKTSQQFANRKDPSPRLEPAKPVESSFKKPVVPPLDLIGKVLSKPSDELVESSSPKASKPSSSRHQQAVVSEKIAEAPVLSTRSISSSTEASKSTVAPTVVEPVTPVVDVTLPTKDLSSSSAPVVEPAVVKSVQESVPPQVEPKSEVQAPSVQQDSALPPAASSSSRNLPASASSSRPAESGRSSSPNTVSSSKVAAKPSSSSIAALSLDDDDDLKLSFDDEDFSFEPSTSKSSTARVAASSTSAPKVPALALESIVASSSASTSSSRLPSASSPSSAIKAGKVTKFRKPSSDTSSIVAADSTRSFDPTPRVAALAASSSDLLPAGPRFSLADHHKYAALMASIWSQPDQYVAAILQAGTTKAQQGGSASSSSAVAKKDEVDSILCALVRTFAVQGDVGHLLLPLIQSVC